MKKHTLTYILFFISLFNLTAQELSVSFTKTEAECVAGKASISVISAAQPYNVTWSTGSTMNEVDELVSGEYSVYIKDNHNNDTTIYFTIDELICEPVPENHFTPNGDGYNDTWSIGRLENFPTFELFVYNRWGQQVHHQANSFIPWNGFSFGIPLPDATYYYVLFFSRSDKNKFIKGDVSILR